MVIFIFVTPPLTYYRRIDFLSFYSCIYPCTMPAKDHYSPHAASLR